MNKTKSLVVFGDSAFAEIAYEYFTHDSPYQVVAFTVSKDFLTKHELFGIPVVPYEDIETLFPPSENEMHIALVYNNLNRVRIQFYEDAKQKGYTLANYISSRAFVWRNVEMGDNCFVFEDNTIQPFVKIGSNNVFWSGNHIGHHSVIGSHNFISSHVVISGFCTIGNANFIGVNATMGNNLSIGNDCMIGSAVHIVRPVKDGALMKGVPTHSDEKSTYERFGIEKKMKWRKLGLVLAPDKSKWWSQYYAMMPTPIYLHDEGLIRVYYGTTDKDRFGRTSYVDLSASDPTNIKSKSLEISLDTGVPGTFDDSGAVPSSVLIRNSEVLLFYVGFQRTVHVPYMLMTGLAIGDGLNFKRYSQAPIIDRSLNNVYSNAAPFVLYDQMANCYRMWLWVAENWITVNNKLYLKASIHHAISFNAVDWTINEKPCLAPDPQTEFTVGRPWVLKEHDIYKMYYSVRHKEKLYRLGYAESPDGLNWKRKDELINIDVSKSGWDSEMICYPSVITVHDKTYLFYNGNNNGETGFGVAILEQD